MRRRVFVAMAGSIGTVGFAGCAEDTDEPDAQAEVEDEDSTEESDEESTPEGTEAPTETSPEETETPTETSTPEQSAEAEQNAIGYPSDFIEVREVEYNPPEDQYSGPSVTGVADNVAGEKLSYVEVQVQAFNENDEQIAEALDNTTDLREGKSWRFECEFFDADEENIEYWMGRAEISNY